MTILPKKKQNNKETRPNSSDHGHNDAAHSSHQDGAGNSGVRSTSSSYAGVGESSTSLRRPLTHHFHDLQESDGNLNGPHRKRVAVIQSGRQERSSPHRNIRKNRNVASARLSPGPEEQDPECNSEDEYEQSAKGVEFSDEVR